MGTATSGLELPTSSVWPSGGSFSSAVGASAPCDPAMFTIENRLTEGLRERRQEDAHGGVGGPPGGNGISRRTGLLGYGVCA